MKDDAFWMREAINLAKRAEEDGEVPVGALIVINNELVSEGWNQPIASNDSSAHAEIQAIRSATTKLQNYRLIDATLYCTLEPCVMCAGAIFHARIIRVVFGAYDLKAGSAGSVIDLFSNPQLNHHATIKGGVLEHDCAQLLKQFFKARR
jgi:tRNA(adenine34) deaminase